jgi:hypothetical protein
MQGVRCRMSKQSFVDGVPKLELGNEGNEGKVTLGKSDPRWIAACAAA